MARVPITKRDGKTTPYFWSDKEEGAPKLKTVYKQTADGVRRMKGARFDPVANRMHKD